MVQSAHLPYEILTIALIHTSWHSQPLNHPSTVIRTISYTEYLVLPHGIVDRLDRRQMRVVVVVLRAPEGRRVRPERDARQF